MNDKKLEVTEIIVKPSNNYWLQVTNHVNAGIYEALDDPYYSAYNVRKDRDNYFVDVRSQEIGYYSNDMESSGQATISWDSSVEFSDMRVVVDGNIEKKKVVVMNGSVARGPDFKQYNLLNMDGIIELDSGKFLINRYGKYQPNISFINNVPEVKFESVNPDKFNLPEGSFSVAYGDFFISKKGTKCFRILPKEKAKHILIRDNWGGAFNDYRGRTLSEDKAVYYRRASSNRGGSGYDYGIYDKNFRNIVSEDDI